MSASNGSTRPVPEFVQKKGALPGFEGLKEHWCSTSKNANMHFYANAPGVGPSDGPILILAHGFPQTAYIFRYMIPQLQQKYRLFVPDQPGIAYSDDVETQDRLTLGTCYIEALVSCYGKGCKVILGGHDRGARVMQRLAVSRDKFPDIEVLAVFMLDIVPIVEQFRSFSNPMAATRYFHWSFLPVVPIAVPMIMAFGGDKWIKTLFAQIAGSKKEDEKYGMEADDGIEVSAAWYSQQTVNEAAAKDYGAAANEDYKQMVEDQENGRKIDVPTLVCHCVGLAQMNDVQKVWPQYVKEGTKLDIQCPGEGFGHYMPEECPDWTTAKILAFLKSNGLQGNRVS